MTLILGKFYFEIHKIQNCGKDRRFRRDTWFGEEHKGVYWEWLGWRLFYGTPKAKKPDRPFDWIDLLAVIGALAVLAAFAIVICRMFRLY